MIAENKVVVNHKEKDVEHVAHLQLQRVDPLTSRYHHDFVKHPNKPITLGQESWQQVPVKHGLERAGPLMLCGHIESGCPVFKTPFFHFAFFFTTIGIFATGEAATHSWLIFF
uniref:Uncharacterized protein n=1 Tax=Heterosigma akashiwo TaxID=2829 RepID=A0A6V1RYI5_HETAK